MTIPGVGCDGAAGLRTADGELGAGATSPHGGLVPRQHTTGGKPRLGKISKMGQRDLRRLLITGAMRSYGTPPDVARRRTLGWPVCWRASRGCSLPQNGATWALTTKKENYRAPGIA